MPTPTLSIKVKFNSVEIRVEFDTDQELQAAYIGKTECADVLSKETLDYIQEQISLNYDEAYAEYVEDKRSELQEPELY